MSAFEDFLKQLAPVFQFETLAPDSNGACLIILKEGNIPLLFEFDEQLVPNKVLLSSPIVSFPLEQRRAVYEATLKENTLREETLSVKPDEDLLFIHRRFNPMIKTKDLEPLIENFLKTIRLWRTKVTTLTTSPSGADQLPHHPTPIQVFPYKA